MKHDINSINNNINNVNNNRIKNINSYYYCNNNDNRINNNNKQLQHTALRPCAAARGRCLQRPDACVLV